MDSLKRIFVFCAVFVILYSTVFFFEAVASTAGHVVINEFELNPPGNDNYQSVEEWVELYNLASESVDIGGWTLSTSHGETVTVSIPDGTVIEAEGYYVFSRGSQWLNNDDESIILQNAEGDEIDRTPVNSDNENDDRSWARYPDGQDTDSDIDWSFQTSTKGTSNGEAPTPTPTPIPTPSPTPTPTPTPTPPPMPLSENVTLHFIDVGQGDSIFVDTPDLDMLVDGGPTGAGETVVEYLLALNVTRIDIVVATHPHEDHIGGLITVLTEYNITQIPVIVDSGYEATTKTYIDYNLSLGQRTVQFAARGDSFYLDDGVNVTILNPTSPLEFDDANDNSIVLRVQVHNVSFLLTGDSEAPSETSIMMAGLSQSCKILKIGHHGSRTSTSSAYLEAIYPEVVVISVGEGNRYGHPHQETLDKLAVRGLTVYRTDFNGTVQITTNGVDYSVKTEKPSPTIEGGLTPSPSPSPTPTPSPTPSPTPTPEPTDTGLNLYLMAAAAILAVTAVSIMVARRR